MQIKIILLSVLITLMSLSVLSANSVFSFTGIPNNESNSDIYGSGMGETGIGDVFRINTGYSNPSLATTINQVHFSSGIVYGYFYYYDEAGNDFRKDGIHFPYFNFTVPLSRHRIGFDFTPILSGSADVYSYDRTFELEGESYNYTEINKVRSYIYKTSFFYAYKHRILNTGISFDYFLGHHFRAWSQEFEGMGNAINPRYELNQTFRSPGISIGVNRNFGNYALGALYRIPVSLEGDKELVTVHSVYDMGDSNFELPQKTGIGMAYKLTDNYRLTADLEYEFWSETDFYDDPSDTYSIGLGLAYTPYWGRDRWYRRIPLRIGGYYRTLPFQANGNDLNEMALTCGITIPLQSPNNQIDLSLKYMVRGDKDENRYQDRNILFGISLSGFDFFRSRPKRIGDREIPEAEFETYR